LVNSNEIFYNVLLNIEINFISLTRAWGVNMALVFSFRQLFSELSNFSFPTIIVDRDISVCPTWLYALVGFLCFVQLAIISQKSWSFINAIN